MCGIGVLQDSGMFDQDILQKRIGIVGGGQLGRMLTVAAIRLGFSVVVLDAEPVCPAAQVGAIHR
jgi:phosphoribosylaminoimidazole carboxylase (NCAIR synthetase)